MAHSRVLSSGFRTQSWMKQLGNSQMSILLELVDQARYTEASLAMAKLLP